MTGVVAAFLRSSQSSHVVILLFCSLPQVTVSVLLISVCLWDGLCFGGRVSSQEGSSVQHYCDADPKTLSSRHQKLPHRPCPSRFCGSICRFRGLTGGADRATPAQAYGVVEKRLPGGQSCRSGRKRRGWWSWQRRTRHGRVEARPYCAATARQASVRRRVSFASPVKRGKQRRQT